ncbi:hypothetical protein [Enhydrobacter sp.]|jgi:hypothetical protein|uniref:hypothetical protein n=1 Tax=Enhydrobacter sp. TaxID=1894999 RepID=UPI002608E584|nr:hypothetical protein [Enhydrobacter sp.]WIM13520.1 MAG: hypothetical protein OJF58_004488 [Enhydrobacter sp.]
MTLWRRIIGLFGKKKIDPAGSDRGSYDPRAAKEAADAKATDAAHIADARLPPHSATFPF